MERWNFIVTSSVLVMDAAPDSDNKQYKCSVSTKLKGDGRHIFYNVTYAIGPSVCDVKPDDSRSETLNMCNKTNISLTVICQVNNANSRPGIKTVFYVNTSQVTNMNENQTNSYSTKQELSIVHPGIATVDCQAMNSIFSDVYINCSYSAIIIAPPSKAPNVYITSDRQSSLTSYIEDTVYIVTCSVDDGVPLVSNITVSCGNITGVTQIGNIFTAAIKFSRNMTGQNCTCTAQHISGCYVNNTSHLPIQVAYVPSVTNFRSQNSVTFVKNGTWTELVCEADGYPSPKISILKGNDIVIQIPSGHFINYSYVLSCKDSGIYVCQADNGIYTDNLLTKQCKATVIFVVCSLQLNNFNELKKYFKHQLGDDFSYSFDIFGYPFPKSFAFLKFDKEKNVSIQIDFNDLGNSIFVNNRYKMKVSYSAKDLPNGMIEIILSNLSISDFTYYTLVVNQNGFDDLEYSFIITEDIKMSDAVNGNDINIAAAVGGSITALVIIIFIAFGVFVKIKYTITIQKKKPIKNKNIHNYSELAVSQQPQDRHNYETPNINPEADTTNRRTNYVNVPDGHKEDHPYDQITNEV